MIVSTFSSPQSAAPLPPPNQTKSPDVPHRHLWIIIIIIIILIILIIPTHPPWSRSRVPSARAPPRPTCRHVTSAPSAPRNSGRGRGTREKERGKSDEGKGRGREGGEGGGGQARADVSVSSVCPCVRVFVCLCVFVSTTTTTARSLLGVCATARLLSRGARLLSRCARCPPRALAARRRVTHVSHTCHLLPSPPT